MTPEILAAVERLRAEQRRAEERFAEMSRTLESVGAALEAGDRAEASRLLSAACDLEYETTWDAEALGPLFDALGLDDEAAPDG